MKKSQLSVLSLSLLFLLRAPGGALAVAPRYHIVIRDVEAGPGVAPDDPALRMARQVFEEELKKRPEVAMAPADAEGGKIKSYQLTLRVLADTRALKPPPPGKQYRVLERSIKLTILGTTLKEDMLAIGGNGESTIQADVGATVTERQEQELLVAALHDATAHAVAETIRKLKIGGMTPPAEKPRRHRHP